jgi:hypothetical protein
VRYNPEENNYGRCNAENTINDVITQKKTIKGAIAQKNTINGVASQKNTTNGVIAQKNTTKATEPRRAQQKKFTRMETSKIGLWEIHR